MTFTSLPTIATPTALSYTLWTEIKDNFDYLFGGGGIGTSLPASPVDGQPYTLVDSTSAPTYAWRIRYVSAASKWLFVGGSPLVAYTAAAAGASVSTSYIDGTSPPTITVPIVGVYHIEHS